MLRDVGQGQGQGQLLSSTPRHGQHQRLLPSRSPSPHHRLRSPPAVAVMMALGGDVVQPPHDDDAEMMSERLRQDQEREHTRRLLGLASSPRLDLENGDDDDDDGVPLWVRSDGMWDDKALAN
jgi:hypothetical protein